jgi:hypothetical protein
VSAKAGDISTAARMFPLLMLGAFASARIIPS